MQFGEIELYVLSDGHFRLDGGAMFGVVPKALWHRSDPADDKNRILLGLNALLVVRDEQRILVDSGIGNKYDEKFADIYAVQREHTLPERLQDLGLGVGDITHVVMTHLHFDHIGWSTIRNEHGDFAPTFPKALYYCQRGEYEYGLNPDPRSRASYVQENFVPLTEHGVLKFLDGDGEILPGIEAIVTGGHTRDHSIIKVSSAGQTACFLADLVPTPSHLKTPYVMGYDLYPAQTMAMKPVILKQAIAEHWLLIFEHAPRVKAGYLYDDKGKYRLEEVRL